MPNCYTALEELVYTFGGPWLFCLLLMGLLILLALVLSVARMKFFGVDESPGPAPTQHGSQIDHSFPFLESLNEVFLQMFLLCEIVFVIPIFFWLHTAFVAYICCPSHSALALDSIVAICVLGFGNKQS